MNGFDRAAEQIEDMLERGEISSKEYEEYMADLRQEQRESAQEAAQQAYDDAMGGW